MATQQEIFIQTVGPIIQAKARERGYKFPSAIIAQACLESRFGQSGLGKAPNYNLFGMKASKAWLDSNKPVVRMQTKEQNKDGSYVTITAAFRKYNSYAECIDGYFDFISATRYQNLKEATSSRDYLEKIRADGYATSLAYVTNVYNVVNLFNLQFYDGESKLEQLEKDDQVMGAARIIALAVLDHRCGNGDERKDIIYRLVQNRVNEMVSGRK